MVGLGVGALAILLGLTMRDAAARWRPVRPDQPLPPARIARRMAIGRAGRAGGLVLCLAGAAIAVVTLIALVLGLSDRVGAILVMVVISVAVLGGIAWGITYTHRYHPRPLPVAPGRRPLPTPPAETPASLTATIDAAVGQHGPAAPAEADDPADQPEVPPASADAPADEPADAPDEAGADTDRPLRERNGSEPPAQPGTEPDADATTAGEAQPRPLAHATSRKGDGA